MHLLDEALRELGGKIPDTRLAERIGVSSSAVSKRRAELGISVCHRRQKVIDRQEKIVAFLDDQYDAVTLRVIAKALKESTKTVSRDLCDMSDRGIVICADRNPSRKAGSVGGKALKWVGA